MTTGLSLIDSSAISLLPSMMHRLENLLVTIELKELLTVAFPEGSKATALDLTGSGIDQTQTNRPPVSKIKGQIIIVLVISPGGLTE